MFKIKKNIIICTSNLLDGKRCEIKQIRLIGPRKKEFQIKKGKKEFIYKEGEEITIEEFPDNEELILVVFNSPLEPKEFWPDRELVIVFKIDKSRKAIKLYRRVLWHKKESAFDVAVPVV